MLTHQMNRKLYEKSCFRIFVFFDIDRYILDITSYIISVTRHEIKVIRSQRGKELITIDGYTFAQTSRNTWPCSTRNRNCKAKLKLDDQRRIVSLCNEHCHPPKTTLYMPVSDTFVRI